MKKKTLKGFSMIELVVAVAIIGVLAGILVPSAINYYRSARIKTQNSNAKIVFNAAQTIAQRYEMQARSLGTVILTGGDTTLMVACSNDALLSASGPTASNTVYQEFCDRVNDIYFAGSDTTWAVYIDHYIVKSTLCAEELGSKYVGRFPVPTTADDVGASTMPKLESGISLSDMVGQANIYGW